MYLIMNAHTLRSLNSAESITSSSITFGPTIQPTKMQVSSATIGIITELERKSRKSRMVVPSPKGWMNESEL